MVNQRFQHQPLDLNKMQIRLFRLTGEISNPKLTGTVAIHDLGTCPEYKAVSYTWGPPSLVHEIDLDGESFSVRDNLWHFLNTARRHHSGTWFWIDQICIDQNTVLERNHQVSLMADIFKEAVEVFIWLGPESKGSNEAMIVIESGNRDRIELCQTRVKALFKRPYWKRLWIIQEVLMSRKAFVLCGDRMFNWETLEILFVPPRTTTWLWEPPVDLDKIALSLIEEKASFTGADQRLSYILDVFSGWECEDVRDKIYGLLSLVRNSSTIPVDYSKRPADLFFDTIQRIVADDIAMRFDSLFDACQQLRNRMQLTFIEDSVIAALVKHWLRTIDLESKSDRGWTPLLWAAENGYTADCEQLLEDGADPNCEDTVHRMTPLLLAARNGHQEIVTRLLEKGAAPDCQSKAGNSPLLLAASNGHQSIVARLFEKGVDLNRTNTDGYTPLLHAALNGHQAIVSQLLDRGAEPNCAATNGRSPLSEAALRGHDVVVEQLLSRGANPNIIVGQDSALSLALRNHRWAIAKQLIDKGANVDCMLWDDETPLLIALSYQHLELVKMLVQKGAGVNRTNGKGRMPLLEAAKLWGVQHSIVKMMLDQGANPDYEDGTGSTLRSWAESNGNKPVIKLINRRGRPDDFEHRVDKVLESIMGQLMKINPGKYTRGEEINVP